MPHELNSQPAKPMALVTGAARRLGRAIALGLAAEGYAIGLHYHHSEAEAITLAAEIAAIGGESLLLAADLTRPAEIEAMFAAVAKSGFPLRVLVNSAGEMRRATLDEDAPADWDATFDLNLRAVWLCARHACALMRSHGGAIINISDAGAGRPWTGYAAYTVSKAALEALTRLQAKQYAPAVRVNGVAPGLILPSEDLSEEAWQRLNARLPLQADERCGAVVQAVVFLIQNLYITGEVIAVDGGYRLT
ncbi:MAG: SDR family oxidoreductase [Chloroflexi bacterium]|nr:SDR family oxidoreductase [Chloroflexota bacterium]